MKILTSIITGLLIISLFIWSGMKIGEAKGRAYVPEVIVVSRVELAQILIDAGLYDYPYVTHKASIVGPRFIKAWDTFCENQFASRSMTALGRPE